MFYRKKLATIEAIKKTLHVSNVTEAKQECNQFVGQREGYETLTRFNNFKELMSQ